SRLASSKHGDQREQRRGRERHAPLTARSWASGSQPGGLGRVLRHGIPSATHSRRHSSYE
ncbi:MAG: hypothetical protein ACREJP_07250, partial [Candidatus Methylomirabilales bacterium]